MRNIRALGIGAALAGGAAYLAQRLARRAERAGCAVDDVTLARKVESELFREDDAPKGQLDVNAADGVVQLRGEVDSPELIDALVRRARSVRGVRDVENLLQTPGTEAPMHQ